MSIGLDGSVSTAVLEVSFVGVAERRERAAVRSSISEVIAAYSSVAAGREEAVGLLEENIQGLVARELDKSTALRSHAALLERRVDIYRTQMRHRAERYNEQQELLLLDIVKLNEAVRQKGLEVESLQQSRKSRASRSPTQHHYLASATANLGKAKMPSESGRVSTKLQDLLLREGVFSPLYALCKDHGLVPGSRRRSESVPPEAPTITKTSYDVTDLDGEEDGPCKLCGIVKGRGRVYREEEVREMVQKAKHTAEQASLRKEHQVSYTSLEQMNTLKKQVHQLQSALKTTQKEAADLKSRIRAPLERVAPAIPVSTYTRKIGNQGHGVAITEYFFYIKKEEVESTLMHTHDELSRQTQIIAEQKKKDLRVEALISKEGGAKVKQEFQKIKKGWATVAKMKTVSALLRSFSPSSTPKPKDGTATTITTTTTAPTPKAALANIFSLPRASTAETKPDTEFKLKHDELLLTLEAVIARNEQSQQRKDASINDLTQRIKELEQNLQNKKTWVGLDYEALKRENVRLIRKKDLSEKSFVNAAPLQRPASDVPKLTKKLAAEVQTLKADLADERKRCEELQEATSRTVCDQEVQLGVLQQQQRQITALQAKVVNTPSPSPSPSPPPTKPAPADTQVINTTEPLIPSTQPCPQPKSQKPAKKIPTKRKPQRSVTPDYVEGEFLVDSPSTRAPTPIDPLTSTAFCDMGTIDIGIGDVSEEKPMGVVGVRHAAVPEVHSSLAERSRLTPSTLLAEHESQSSVEHDRYYYSVPGAAMQVPGAHYNTKEFVIPLADPTNDSVVDPYLVHEKRDPGPYVPAKRMEKENSLRIEDDLKAKVFTQASSDGVSQRMVVTNRANVWRIAAGGGLKVSHRTRQRHARNDSRTVATQTPIPSRQYSTPTPTPHETPLPEPTPPPTPPSAPTPDLTLVTMSLETLVQTPAGLSVIDKLLERLKVGKEKREVRSAERPSAQEGFPPTPPPPSCGGKGGGSGRESAVLLPRTTPSPTPLPPRPSSAPPKHPSQPESFGRINKRASALYKRKSKQRQKSAADGGGEGGGGGGGGGGSTPEETLGHPFVWYPGKPSYEKATSDGLPLQPVLESLVAGIA